MKRVLPIILVLVLAGVGYWFVQTRLKLRVDPVVTEFHNEAANLIEGLQQYKEFVGSYPAGNAVDIAKSLSGQTDKKILILATSKNKKNAKGEIVDPWGTPLQFYFAHNAVLVRSAGPNKIFEDSSVATSDDLYRSETK
jgi:hypothetical protein